MRFRNRSAEGRSPSMDSRSRMPQCGFAMPHIPLSTTACLLLATSLCHSETAGETTPQISVGLYDYSAIRPALIKELSLGAEATFRRAGIEIHWRYFQSAGRCKPVGEPFPDIGPLISVAILPEGMSRKIASNTREFGLANGAGEATNAYVFFDRALKFADAEDAPWTPILAKIIAHEVGHLLLGNDSHSRSGIMRAHWRSGEVRQALMGDLTFTPQQAEIMRVDVRRRIALCRGSAWLPNPRGVLRESALDVAETRLIRTE